MRFTTTLYAALLATAVSAGKKNKAIFWSGTDYEACNKTTWDDNEKALASTPRNMDGAGGFFFDNCNADQPKTGDNPGPRQYIWIPNINTGEERKEYCLVMSQSDHCGNREGSSCKAGETLDIVLNATSMGCLKFPEGINRARTSFNSTCNHTRTRTAESLKTAAEA